METGVEEELEVGGVVAAVNETEAVITVVKTEWFLPSPDARQMRTLSRDAFRAIELKFKQPNTRWQSVVAEHDTVLIQNEDGETLLHCFAGNSGGLTTAGVPANMMNRGRASALSEAARCGDLEECKLLSEYGADINIISGSPMHAAIDRRHYEIVRWLITHPQYARRWERDIFTEICNQIPQFVVPYLELLAPPQPYEHLDRLNKGPVEDFGSRTGVNYRHLTEIYGSPTQNVAETALAHW